MTTTNTGPEEGMKMDQLDRFLLFHRQEQEWEKAERDEALRKERLAKEQSQLKARIVLLKDMIT